MNALEKRLAWARVTRSGRSADFAVVLLATYTIDPLVPALGMALELGCLTAAIHVGPFDQIVPQCLDSEGVLATLRPDVLVVHGRLEDLWAGSPVPLEADPAHYADGVLHLAEASLRAARRWGITLVFVLPAVPETPPLGVGDAGCTGGVAACAAYAREALRRLLASQPGVLLADCEAVVRTLGTERAFAPALEALARVPYAEGLYERLGEQIGRLIMLSRRAAPKVLVLDADGTLWGGVVGEDETEGLAIGGSGAGAAHAAFQRQLLALREAGVLLALASKNEPADVWAAFAHPSMVLRREHLASWRIGWGPKSEAILAMAEELGLDPSAFVLIDDNPAELAEVAAACPAIACLRFPADPAEWRMALHGAGVLDRLPPTAADRDRASGYEAERKRRDAGAMLDPETYLASLGLEVSMSDLEAATLPRLAQLVAKTNQFNLACRRRSAAELQGLMSSADYIVRLVSARDHFGDYGFVGAGILAWRGDAAVLDTFLLSCRAMGRGIEFAMLADLQERAADRGWGHVMAALETHPRNEPARAFFVARGATAALGPLAPCAWPPHVGLLARRDRVAP